MTEKAEDLSRELDELSRKIISMNPGEESYKTCLRRISRISPIVEKHKERLEIKRQIAEAEEIKSETDDNELSAMADEEQKRLLKNLNNLDGDIASLIKKFEKSLDETFKGVIVEIRAGAGGDEAALFAGDLFNMYYRFAEGKNWKIEMIDAHRSDMGGYKEIVFGLEGEEVWDLMRLEGGVHRVQRIPATESSGRIHTSTVTVAVLPEISDEEEFEIDPGDLRIDTYRSSGAGGQHVNVTDSAVRITHIPTGVVVQCQDERSQHKNKAKAMRVLKAKLSDFERARKKKETEMNRSNQVKTGDRSQKIRTYNFPQNRLTDHRINYSIHKLDSVMKGDMDQLFSVLSEKLDEED
jgi:peptide chain release factor 1